MALVSTLQKLTEKTSGQVATYMVQLMQFLGGYILHYVFFLLPYFLPFQPALIFSTSHNTRLDNTGKNTTFFRRYLCQYPVDFFNLFPFLYQYALALKCNQLLHKYQTVLITENKKSSGLIHFHSVTQSGMVLSYYTIHIRPREELGSLGWW